jgi:hypothetical protein
MLQRGDIVVERLTGNRAIVIQTPGSEEITCRFSDGRLEDRYTFEVEPAGTLLASLLSLILLPFVRRPGARSSASVGDRTRPLLVRQPASS